MSAPVLKSYTIYRDRYMAAGAAPIDLYAKMVSPFMPTPVGISISWTTGTAAHWSSAGGVIAASAAGEAAHMSSQTYIATVTMTWAEYASPNNTASATLTVICPAFSVYVDPATGSPSNAGTKASPWQHSPDDVLASGNELSFTPSGLTLCVFKDGSITRSRMVPRFNNLLSAAQAGWGDGSKAVLCGADLLPVPTAPMSGDVFGNPNIANIQKFTTSAPRTIAQFLIDRGDINDGLVQWAQWPAAGESPYTDSYDPFRNGSGGMYQVPASSIVLNGVQGVWTCPSNLYAAFDAEFGSNSCIGSLFGFSGNANFVGWYIITAHDIPGRVITFACTKAVVSSAAPAVQICGHPASIKGPGQFAWKADAFVSNAILYAWFYNGTAPEVMVRTNAVRANFASTVTSGAIQGFSFQGYYGDAAAQDGSGVAIDKTTGTSWKVDVLDNESRWLVCRNVTGAMFRATNITPSDGSRIQGNIIRSSVGTALWRISCGSPSSLNINTVVIGNEGYDLTATSGYFSNFGPTSKVLFTYLEGGSGPHANCLTFYNTPYGEIAYNYAQGARMLTIQNGGASIHNNLFVMDKQQNGASLYQGGHVFDRNIWARYPNFAGTGDKVVSCGTDAIVNTHTNSVFDGLTGGLASIFTDNLVSNIARAGNPIYNNVAPNSGNVLEPFLWDGTIPSRWRAVVGTGMLGPYYIYGVVVMPQPINLINQEVSTTVYTEWLGPIEADTLADIVLTNCEMSRNTVPSDSGATPYSPTPGNAIDLNGLYAKFRLTTTSSYANDNNAVIDFGNGNIYNWTVTTKQAAGYPLIDVDPNDFWKWGAATPLGAADSKTLTFALFANISSNATGNVIGQYASGGVSRVNIELLNATPKRFRVTLRDPSSAVIAQFNSASISPLYDQNSMYLMTVDMTAANAVDGVKVYGNGVDVGPTVSTGAWVQNSDIGWAWTGTGQTGFNIADITGKVGMVFLDHGFVDITDSEVRDRFNAHRIGTNGQLVMGRPADNVLIGVVSDWMNAAGLNRGSQSKYIAQPGTDVTLDSGGAQTWPAFSFATALVNMTGPSGQVGATRDYEVSVNGALADPVDVLLSDGGRGGLFTPTTLTFDPAEGAATQSFTYRPAATGATLLTASASGLSSTSLEVPVEAAPATSYTISGPPAVGVGAAALITVSLNGSNSAGVSIDFVPTGAPGVFSANPVLVEPDAVLATVTFTPSAAGVAVITPSSAGALIDPPPLRMDVFAPQEGATVAQLIRLGIRP